MNCPSETIHFNGAYVITNDYQLLPFARLCTAFAKSSGSEHTERARMNDLNHLLAFMSSEPSCLRLGDYNKATIDRFILRQLDKHKVSVVARRFWTFRAFDKWLEAAIPGFEKPTDNISPPAVEEKAFKGIPPEDAERLMEKAYTIGNTPLIRMRNGVAVELILSTGLRAGEAASVRVEQLSNDGRWIRDVRCKGNYFRDVYLPKSFDKNLSAYLKIREFKLRLFGVRRPKAYPLIIPTIQPEGNKPDDYIVDPKTLWRIIDAAAEAANLEGVHPHTLRHTYAHNLLENTKDVRLVAQALGHRSLDTTMRYTQRSEDRIGELIEEAFNGEKGS